MQPPHRRIAIFIEKQLRGKMYGCKDPTYCRLLLKWPCFPIEIGIYKAKAGRTAIRPRARFA